MAGTKQARTLAVQRAVGAVRNALSEQGINPQTALQYARVILSRPGVQIGRGGNIFYQGQRYAPSAFASSKLAQIATGQQAQKLNQQAVQGDPGYLQALATLGLNRDQATSDLEAQRRQQLLQFGDPSFVSGDPTLAAAAGANPFSTVALMQQAYQNAQSAAAQAANRAGTYYGGGEVSGQQEAGRVNAAQNQQATTALQNLLNSISQQEAQLSQQYDVGKTGAYQDAYNALLASGAIHAAHAPAWGVGRFQVRGYGHAPVPHPPTRVGTGGGPTPPPVGQPPVLNQPTPQQPVRTPQPPSQGFPTPTLPSYTDYTQRYGLGY